MAPSVGNLPRPFLVFYLKANFPSILNNRPTIWLIEQMKTIGIFEAKTHFPSLCQEVARSQSPILVQKRGQPLVIISPVNPKMGQVREDIYEAWKGWKGKEDTADFLEVWKERTLLKPITCLEE